MENKKKKYLLLGIVGAVLLGIIIFAGVKIIPKVQIGKEISDLLEPLLAEENQSMHLSISADLAGELVDFHSDLYLLEEEETKYVVMDQYDFPIYIVDNVLYLSNGHAFLIAEEAQSQSVEEAEKVTYEDLFLQIAAAYEIFDITCVRTDLETSYSVNVTGEQVQKLLQMAVVTGQGSESEIQEFLGNIKNLNLQMTARKDKLDRIEMTGSADIGDTSVQVNIVMSEFNVLDTGEYVIPDVIKDAVKTVDKDSLFSLTEDLYRLLVAFEQFSKQETPNGTVTLHANCGIINFEQTYNLKDFENMGNAGDADNIDNSFVDMEGIEKLPEMIGFLCMEGEITTTQMDNGYEYKLALDKDSMQKIAEMVVPDLVNYVVTMKEGTVVVMLENDNISSIAIEIDGSINVLFSEVSAEVGVTFQYYK